MSGTEVARAVVQRLTELGQTVATAESLTGGLVGVTITAVPGASAVYVGGVVSYATEVKQSLLDVPDEIVAEHGVVSAECAAAMAEGVRRLLGSTWAVSTTGVAGPDEQEGKSVGTVFVAISGPVDHVEQLALGGDREAIRAAACETALAMLLSKGRLAGP